jgi:hypothetical protein
MSTAIVAIIGAVTALVIAITGFITAARGLRQGQANGRALNGHKLATDQRTAQLERAIVGLGGTVPRDPALDTPLNPGEVT